MGRKPKPAAEKDLAGNPGKRPLVTDEELDKRTAADQAPDAEAVLAAGEVERPPYITGVAAEFWDDHVDRLKRLRLLKPIDIPAFAMLCVTYAVVRNTLEVITDPERGPTTVVETRHGKMPRKSPAWQVYKEAAQLLQNGLAEFGMTPSGRARAAMGALNPSRPPEGQGALPLDDTKDPKPNASGPVGFIHRAGNA